ncbi:acyltransferase family protein [Flavihumibacter petaseus]|uniref:Uncharacterized protein n=1 Tax=Flavihumibacter petaseus NBRC 106054 TaxID=1220578 RepID=A0A0E9MZQ7_9BACT|nr:DUF5009 domain-containing protein [Flavihumibacter petaseus]GAO42610.1 hypothetical protein FPE01S_01_16250 [Flavihumibacter petaseus NBRC 106054]
MAVNLNVYQRLASLDFLRGLIMLLLAFDATGIYEWLDHQTEGHITNYLARQFVHHPWNGLRLWDLVQPAFMFMAGTAMAFSLKKQWEAGVSWTATFRKALKRSGWLFFWGVLDYAVRPEGLSFELWDVLTQLSFTTLIAFLIFRWSVTAQISVCAGLLLLTECLYRFTHVPGFDQPFTDQHNFGNYIDLLLMNKINSGGWVAINCIPTAVHTIGGALAGKLLQQHMTGNAQSSRKLLQQLFMWGAAVMILGYGLDLAGITPIIKRIATSSFTLASLGWCLWFLAISYWWVDLLQHRKGLLIVNVFGMNAIFIYLFFEIVGHGWFNGYITAITNGVLDWFNAGEDFKVVIAAVAIVALEWLLCLFLYRRKIFFKL